MALRDQVYGLIETCEKVLDTVAKGKEADANKHADGATVQLANKMIQLAQATNANDEVLGAVKLPDNWVPWTALLAAMRTVYQSLPQEKTSSKQTLQG
jgi:hypothetical protein